MASKIDPSIRPFREQIKQHLHMGARVIYDGALLEPTPASRVAKIEQAAAMKLIADKYWYAFATVHSKNDVDAIILDIEQNLLQYVTGQAFSQGVQLSLSGVRLLLHKTKAA